MTGVVNEQLRRIVGTRRRRRAALIRVGWIASSTLQGGLRRFAALPPAVSMRIRNVAEWMNTHDVRIWNEIYSPARRYDVTVFMKAMDDVCQAEARRIQRYGGKVVFDANVNYYEIWGDYLIPGTKPTPQQQRDAIRMAEVADWVVADSSYLLGIVKKFTDRASWIPDNVDLSTYRRTTNHSDRRPFRLVWSGVAKKARHLLLISDIFRELRDAELVVVSDGVPDALGELERALPCRLVPFSDKRYAQELGDCDVILSPKYLVNGYELGHSEYKITLGMAVGLPAVASPQQSYVEAISHRGGGIIAGTPEEWDAALRTLMDRSLRAALGVRAAETVRERYATPVVASQYRDLLLSLG